MKNIILKYTALILLAFGSNLEVIAQAKSTAKVIESDAFDWIFHNIVLLIGAAVMMGVFWTIIDLSNKILQSQKNKYLKEQGIIVPVALNVVTKDSWWKQLHKRSWKLVPIEKEKDILLDHDYDGIRELDNVLPPWWVALFWVGVINGFAYLGYYHVWDLGPSSSEEYVAEMQYANAQVKQFLSRKVEQVDENNVAIVEDETKLNFGGALFIANCAACHGQNGEGGIGPNMTDKYWIHGGHINDIYKTIKYGVPAKGMIAWKSQLRSVDIQNLASYILTLQGTNPANSKEAQGELYEHKEEVTKKQ